MRESAVAFFAMPQAGHFQTLRPLISALARLGLSAYVFTDRQFEADVEHAGGTFVNIFAKYPIDEADGESLPTPCRYVTFAGRYGQEIVRDLEELNPQLVIHDAHAVIGRVVGAALGIPWVTVCPAHNVGVDRLPALVGTLPEISVSAGCSRAVETLRVRYGIADASPFSFASGHSPFLNLYGEPAAFLTEAERRALEPVAFHGCLPSTEEISALEVEGPPYFENTENNIKVYVSFGTVVWRYFPQQALDAVRVLANSLMRMSEVRTVISLGGAELTPRTLAVPATPNVSIVGYADQWQVLREADVFVTHNGLKSTHEAIFNRVPMISYPFFWDQLALAEKCRRFGLAIPLSAAPLAPVETDDVHAALSELAVRGPQMRASLAAAREWELEVIVNRDAVVRRITDLLPG